MTIDELKAMGKCPAWLSAASTEHADVELYPSSSRVVWKEGVWHEGTWENGVWHEGTWENGTWENGTWYGGTWYGGTWYGGTWKGGTWKNGVWASGVWKNGLWKNGTWKNGTWKHGAWYGGTWKNGLWKHGTWENGTWENGTWYGGTWKGGTWKGGNHTSRGPYIAVWRDSDKTVRIGCKKKTIPEWDAWFAGTDEYDTSRESPEFRLIYANYCAIKAYVMALSEPCSLISEKE